MARFDRPMLVSFIDGIAEGDNREGVPFCAPIPCFNSFQYPQ